MNVEDFLGKIRVVFSTQTQCGAFRIANTEDILTGTYSLGSGTGVHHHFVNGVHFALRPILPTYTFEYTIVDGIPQPRLNHQVIQPTVRAIQAAVHDALVSVLPTPLRNMVVDFICGQQRLLHEKLFARAIASSTGEKLATVFNLQVRPDGIQDVAEFFC